MNTEAQTSARPARAAKTKKAAASKKKIAPKKPAARPASTTRGSALDAMTITVKTRENAYKGSRGERFGLLKTGMTVAQYAATAEQKGHKRGRIVSGLRLFERDKHITLS